MDMGQRDSLTARKNGQRERAIRAQLILRGIEGDILLDALIAELAPLGLTAPQAAEAARAALSAVGDLLSPDPVLAIEEDNETIPLPALPLEEELEEELEELVIDRDPEWSQINEVA